MTKDEFLKVYLEYVEPLTNEQRGELLADLLQVNLTLCLEESLGADVKDLFKDKRDKVA